MELGRFKARIESDAWETEIANSGKQDLLFGDIRIENDKIKGMIKTLEGNKGATISEKNFSIYKKGESFIIKTDCFIDNPAELEIKFIKNNLVLFDKKANVEIQIFNKESYD